MVMAATFVPRVITVQLALPNHCDALPEASAIGKV